MLIAALLLIAKKWKEFTCSSADTMDYLSNYKLEWSTLTQTTRWVSLENIMLSDRGQVQRTHIPYMWIVQNRQILETDWQLSRAWGGLEKLGSGLLMGTGWAWRDENALELGSGDSYTSIVNLRKSIELYSLAGSFLQYVNYTLVKLLSRKKHAMCFAFVHCISVRNTLWSRLWTCQFCRW